MSSKSLPLIGSLQGLGEEIKLYTFSDIFIDPIIEWICEIHVVSLDNMHLKAARRNNEQGTGHGPS